MKKYRFIILISILACSMLFMGQTSIVWKPMTFDNPGSRQLLKTEKSSYYFYRSLPEKALVINTKDIQAIEIRAISKKKIDKPQFILKYDDKKTAYNLKFLSASIKLHVYEPVRITLPPAVQKLELICYDRNLYFRAFKPITTQKKKTYVPPLKILNRAGSQTISNNAVKSQYYTFNKTTPFSFQIDKNKAFSLYIRAQLKEKKLPVFELYKDGVFVSNVSLSIKRTKSYTAEGIAHLTIGRKLDYAAIPEPATYELRAVTDNLFFARPVILKTK